ncbi:MAG: 16S rRNA (guanine(966)-N(2))-methyltransferase RsmD [Rhodospirillaceae bacterium TMED167]|nr:16S rRNA (guanine(966)-N(2))-methyltransferase RsmD [Rhodospirillaceae bacterium]OUW23810.1 MAG: 16S rRNA (guanine(966)-N(2))-methyltransferase RsmD [Rhodospirillaceae bacterium TMED167]
MRIVGGDCKGRKLSAPAGRDTRPTSDRARESLFNILRHGMGVELEDARVMDLFAGSGALGLEALSRGATACTFIDRARDAKRCIEDNLTALALTDRGTVLKLDAAHLPPRSEDVAPAHLAFLDPPYGQGLATTALTSLQQGEWLAEKAVIVVETGETENFSAPAPYILADQRTYGSARMCFLLT